MTTASLIHRMQVVDSCVEAVDWVRETRLADLHTAWQALDHPQWMCWFAVRLLHAHAMKAVTTSVRGASKLLPPPAVATLDHALAYVEGKKNDEEALLVEAFDATSTGLHVAGAPGSALIAVGYTAHCAVKLRARAALPSGPENKAERKRLSLRASAHAADAMLHVLLAVPELGEKLPAIIRSHVDERSLSKAWDALPDAPAAKG